MAGGSAIRGSRVGAGPMGEAERGERPPQRAVGLRCDAGGGYGDAVAKFHLVHCSEARLARGE